MNPDPVGGRITQPRVHHRRHTTSHLQAMGVLNLFKSAQIEEGLGVLGHDRTEGAYILIRRAERTLKGATQEMTPDVVAV